MKVKVTEEKLYPVFKKFMETHSKSYKWVRDKNNHIWFVDHKRNGYLELILEKNKFLYIYNDMEVKVLRFFPISSSMLKSLMVRWVEETFQIKGIKSRLK